MKKKKMFYTFFYNSIMVLGILCEVYDFSYPSKICLYITHNIEDFITK